MTSDTKPAGVVLLAGALGILGIASIGTNLTSVALEWDKVPLAIELFGIAYGTLAMVAARLIWQQSPRVPLAFLGWCLAMACVWAWISAP